MTLDMLKRIESVEEAYANGIITSEELLDFYAEIEIEIAGDNKPKLYPKPTGDLVPVG